MLIIAKQNFGLSVFAPIENEGLRAITYSMDLLNPWGVYLAARAEYQDWREYS